MNLFIVEQNTRKERVFTSSHTVEIGDTDHHGTRRNFKFHHGINEIFDSEKKYNDFRNGTVIKKQYQLTVASIVQKRYLPYS
jgi:hypothetical protein